jgi:hypothetical protein
MLVTKKMHALGLKALHARVEGIKPKTRLETVYRWRSQLNAGKGVKDGVKRLLIDATADTDHPIHWSDFSSVGQQRAA